MPRLRGLRRPLHCMKKLEARLGLRPLAREQLSQECVGRISEAWVSSDATVPFTEVRFDLFKPAREGVDFCKHRDLMTGDDRGVVARGALYRGDVSTEPLSFHQICRDHPQDDMVMGG